MKTMLDQNVKNRVDELVAEAYSGGKLDFEVLCKKFNADVFISDFEDPKTSGMVTKNPSGGFSIYLNKKNHDNRKRFTLAHEIGHIISHELKSKSYEKLEKQGFIERKIINNDPAELEANEIAACILMPEDKVLDFINLYPSASLDDISKHFLVSTEAMSYRLAGLGYAVS